MANPATVPWTYVQSTQVQADACITDQLMIELWQNQQLLYEYIGGEGPGGAGTGGGHVPDFANCIAHNHDGQNSSQVVGTLLACDNGVLLTVTYPSATAVIATTSAAVHTITLPPSINPAQTVCVKICGSRPNRSEVCSFNYSTIAGPCVSNATIFYAWTANGVVGLTGCDCICDVPVTAAGTITLNFVYAVSTYVTAGNCINGSCAGFGAATDQVGYMIFKQS